jgi:hypothetical protein
VTELVLVDGPLDARGLGWVAELYGEADPRWADAAWVRHLLVENPSGAAVHAFAMADERAVGHCCVLPMATRVAGLLATSGKIEALYIAPEHRGDLVEQAGRPTPLAMAMLRALYDFAETRGMGLLHSYSEPALGRLHRIARCLPVTVPTVVRAGILRPVAVARGATGRARLVRLVAGAGQRAWTVLAGLAARATLLRPGAAEVRDATGFPPAALAAAEPPPGRWAISGLDAPGWYTGSPALRCVALPGVAAPLALVRWPGAPGEAAQLVAVELAGGGLRHAVALVAAVAAATRRAGAPQLRWASWDGPDTALVDRACRILGFPVVERELTLYCRTSAPPFDGLEGVAPTPFLTAIF